MKRVFLAFLLALLAGRATCAQDLFAKLEIEPSAVYAGQPFAIRISVYTVGLDLERGPITGLPGNLQQQPFEELQPLSETIGNRSYQVIRYRCEALFPAAGIFHFEPVLQCMAVRTVQTLFFSQVIRTPVQIRAPAFNLTVKPVPLEKAPPGYGGLIGSFSLRATASTNRVLPGDLVTLAFSVSGTGRFDRLPPLGYGTVPGFKLYPIREDKARSGARQRTTVQVAIPQAPDSLALPALTLVAFNPERDAFETLAAGPFRFEPDAGRPADFQPPPLFLTGDEAPGEAPPRRPLHAAPRRWPTEPGMQDQAASLFRKGAEAYAATNLADAVDAYSKLLALGIRTPEVHMNLGAACAAQGQRGKAVVFLLRAVREAPRDTLARAHLADARDPHSPPLLPAWSRLSPGEWRFSAAGFTFLALLLFGLARSRRALLPAALAAVIVAALCGAGCFWWHGGPPQTERIVAAPGVQGRLAPADTAAATLRLDEGAAVRLLETAGDWTRVELGGSTVWLPAAALEKP